MADTEASCKSVKELQKYIEIFFATLAKKDDVDKLHTMVEKCLNQINTQNEVIQQQRLKIDELESRVVVCESVSTKLQTELENSEQYSRRMCLRINGVPVESTETSEDCMKKCKEIFEEIDVNVPDEAIDRAHSIGKSYVFEDIEYKAIIVKFTSWRYRTTVYRNRKKTKYKIFMDLTRKRFQMLNEARELTKNSEKVEFVFSDVNCRLSAKLYDHSFKFFNNIEEFKKIL